MKRLAADTILTAFAIVVTWMIGNVARGPDADPSVVRDLAVGGSLVGGALALEWASKEASNVTH